MYFVSNYLNMLVNIIFKNLDMPIVKYIYE